MRQGVLGSQVPRVEFLPEGVDHPDGDEVVEFVEACGVRLDPWQELVLRKSLRRLGDRWAAFAVGVCAPRQNGKNGITEARELAGACVLGEELVIHSAHLADTSREAFRRLEQILEANEWLSREVRHVWRTNGHEAIEFKGGRRIRFRTRTKGGGRGFSGDCVVLDEPMYLPEVSMGAILPVVSARPDPQIWYTGSAVDQQIHEDGVVFSRVRHRALAGEDQRLAYFEWSVDAESPDEVSADMAGSLDAWKVSNPALGIRIDPAYIADERRELADRTFAVERLGVGDWPSVDGSASFVIHPEAWDALTDRMSKVQDTLWLAFDVSPDRSRTSVAAAGFRSDGVPHVEMTDRRAGTGWVAARVAEIVARHRPAAVVCDAAGPAASLLPDMERLGVQVTTVSAQEHARACGLLFDAVDQGRLRHLGQPELMQAIRGAAKRPLGEAWAWSRKTSAVDISPLVAATLAFGEACKPRRQFRAVSF